MKRLITLIFWFLLTFPTIIDGQVAQFNFPASNSLVVSAKDANVSVSNMSLSTGTIETNITTGTYFPNEPYIEESGGWTATSQATAKNFTFTITANSGYTFSITNISFRAYATSAGPTAFGFAIGSNDIYSVNAPDGSLVEVNQAVSGQTNLSSAVIKIQGWQNNSRTSTGTGAFRLDDVIVTGVVTPAASATKLAITSITPTSPTAGSGFSVTVQAQDNSSNAATVSSTTTVSLSNTGGGTIGGTTSGTISAGGSSVTISGVTLSAAATGVTLTASSTSGDNLTAGTSATFNVLAAASQLAFVGVPSTGSVGVSLSSFTVEARRPDNTVDNTFTGNITIAKASGVGSLTGTLTKAATAGIATFDDLKLDATGVYTLSATSGVLTSTTSGTVTINIADATAILWSNSSGSAWLSGTNWTGNSVPSATQVARFAANPTATTNSVGINMNQTTNNGSSNQIVGAIEVTSTRTTALQIGNSAGSTSGTLTLGGVNVNGTSNVILRNQSSGLLTLQASQSSSMELALGNSTENIVLIDGTGGITISSVISGNSQNLTKSGSGIGVFVLTGANTYTGLTTVSAGTLRLNRTGGTTIPATNNVTVTGGTLQVSTNQALNNLTLNGGNVTVDAGVTLTINGTLALTSGTLTVSGGTLVINGAVTRTSGTIDASNSSATVTFTNGSAITLPSGLFTGNVNNLTINGAGGVTLGSSIVVPSTLTLTSGNITLGTSDLTVGVSGSLSSGTISGGSATSYVITNSTGSLKRNVLSGNTQTLFFPIGRASQYQSATITYTTATTASGDLGARFVTGDPGSTGLPLMGEGGTTIQGVSPTGYWRIDQSASLGGTYTAAVNATGFTNRSGASLATNLSALRLIKRANGGSWALSGTTTSAGPSNINNIFAANLSGFSEFGIGGEGVVLSTEWTYFTVKKSGTTNYLNWQTASETDNSHFEVENATDGLNFTTIGQVKGSGTTNNTREYGFAHANPSVGTNYYRLRQVNFDGSASLSKVVAVENNSGKSKATAFAQGGVLTTQFEAVGETSLFIFDLNGRLLSAQRVDSTQGIVTQRLDISSLPTGIYLLNVKNAAQSETIKFFKN